jgi:hypothetical protein
MEDVIVVDTIVVDVETMEDAIVIKDEGRCDSHKRRWKMQKW